MRVSCSMKGASTLDSASTTVGAPATTICWTARSRPSDPQEMTIETSVSGFTAGACPSSRSTRTSAAVVCGTNAPRTQSMRNFEALASTNTATRTGTSESRRASAPALNVPTSLSTGIFMV